MHFNQKLHKNIEVAGSYFLLILFCQIYSKLLETLNIILNTSFRIFQLYTLAAGVFEFLIELIRGRFSVILFSYPSVTNNFPIKYPESSSSWILESREKLPLDLYFWVEGIMSRDESHL